MFDLNQFTNKNQDSSRYTRRIDFLRSKNYFTESIEKTVSNALDNIKNDKSRSFVIYGEPQSGKTEMMISLTAKLLDEGFKIIIILLNDNVQLLNQNLERFLRSNIDPSPKNVIEIIDPSTEIGESEWIIFSKKNSNDLQKLISKLAGKEDKVIIDDEADFASPNSKINDGEKTKINELVEKLIGNSGIYIGVTATPARLDLNNTFNNENDKWIDFPTHPQYTGQDIFFPVEYRSMVDNLQYDLNLLPDSGDDPKFLREAVFSFLINVAFINLNREDQKNFCMLIHTSGKKVDHSEDYNQIVKILNTLKKDDPSDKNFGIYVKKIWDLAKEKYNGNEDVITKYIIRNISKNRIVVMNSDTDKSNTDYVSATNPAALFTFAIGGNIISRGVTFDNLLSMFFTRDVKHKIQQNTYIQRARMFGSRNEYLQYFDLRIPEELFLNWHKCFVFHKLALQAIKSGKGSPIWIEDTKTSVSPSGSIDKTTVDMNRGEMVFSLFDFNKDIDRIMLETSSNIEKLKKINTIIGDNALPSYLISYISTFLPLGDKSIGFHPIRIALDDNSALDRPKGVFGGEDFNKFPEATHHLMIYRNNYSKARIVYAHRGNTKFIRNRRKND